MNETSPLSVVFNQGNITEWGRLRTVDLLVPTLLGQLLFILQILFTLFTKQATLMRRPTILSLPLQLVLPNLMNLLCKKNIMRRSTVLSLPLQ